MAYLNCPECGLSVALLFPCAPIEHCPRCLARRRRAVELFVSARPPKRDRADEAKPAATVMTAAEPEAAASAPTTAASAPTTTASAA